MPEQRAVASAFTLQSIICKLKYAMIHTIPRQRPGSLGKDQYRYIESSRPRTTAQLSLENTEVHVFNITWCKAGAGKQADWQADQQANQQAD